MADNKFIISTTEHIPGKEYEVLGEVFGLTTQSKNVVRNIGADAVVMMRFDSGSIGTDMQSVAAYGTAVKFK